MIITNDTFTVEVSDIAPLSQFAKDALFNYFGGSITAEAALSLILNKEVVSARAFFRKNRAEGLGLAGLDEDIASADEAIRAQVLPLVNQIRAILDI